MELGSLGTSVDDPSCVFYSSSTGRLEVHVFHSDCDSRSIKNNLDIDPDFNLFLK